MNNIYSIAANLDKREKSKANCFDIVKSAIDSGYNLTQYELAQLYAHFMPPIPAKPKTLEAWVHKAINKKDIRPQLHHVYVREGKAMATDGHRIHAYDTDLQDGYYDQQFNRIDNGDTFPQTHHFFNRKNEIKLDHTIKVASMAGHTDTQIFLIGENEIAINQKYYNDAISNPSKLVSVLCVDDKNQFIRLVFEGGSQAIIMPVRT